MLFRSLDEVLTKSEKAAALLKADTDYKSKLETVRKAVGGLTKTAPPTADGLIGSDIGKINEKINEAKTEAEKPDYEKAMKLLDEADLARESAAVKKKMKGNVVPTEGELTSLISKPGGTKLLDDMIAGLGSAAKQDILLVAMKARFGLDAAVAIKSDVDTAADTPEGPKTRDADLSFNKIYELLVKIPDKHTKDNPSFKKIKRYKGDPSEAGKKAKKNGDYYDPTTDRKSTRLNSSHRT